MSGEAAYHSSDAGDRVDRKAALVNKLQTQHDSMTRLMYYGHSSAPPTVATFSTFM